MSKTNNNSITEFLKNSIMTLVFLVPFADLIVSNTLYFPFITGKGFVARTLIIIIALLYVFLVSRDRSYLPKKSSLVWSAIAFISVLLVATINSINPWRSFWSNQERMEGFMTLAEMFVLFISTAGVFGNIFTKQSREKSLSNSSPSSFGVWRWFLNTMLALSVIMGLYAFSQMKDSADRIFGTLGNSSYLGGYAMVHFFLAMYLAINLLEKIFFSQKVKKDGNYLEYIYVTLYALVGIFNLFVVYQTGTRGSFVGLLIGLFITGIIWAIAEKRFVLFRWIGIVSVAVVIIAVTTLGLTKNTTVIKNSYLLNRFASLVTLDFNKVLENQGFSRSLIWKMAYEGVKEKPILGWGQDNYPYVFAKHYIPAMYAQEQWFDRTHDVFFDWLIAAGILGLIAYLSLFVSAFYTLWRKEDDNWSVSERGIITGMLIAYFVHNIFVFDNLASYIFFFTILAFINTRGQGKGELNHKPLIEGGTVWAIDAVAVLIFAYIMWISVLSPYISSGKLIQAMQEQQQVITDGKAQIVPADPKIRFSLIKSAVDANDLTRSEARERLVDISTSVITQTAKTDPAFAQAVYKYVIDQYNKEFAVSKTDPRPYFFYTIFQQKVGDLKGALDTANKMISLSPTKQSFLFTQGQLLLSLARKDEAMTVFKRAYELDKTDLEALKYYIFSLIENNKLDQVDKLMIDQDKITPNFDKSAIWTDSSILQALADIKAFDRAISYAKQKVDANPKDVQSLVSLSVMYLKAGDRGLSIETLKKIKSLKPEYGATVDNYIKQIEEGKDPSATPAQTN